MPTIPPNAMGANGLRVASRSPEANLIQRAGSLSFRDALPSAVGFPLTPEKWRPIADRLQLSRRESEIARLVLDNISEEVIATHLSISPSTVHAHVERMYRKLKVHSRHELVIRLFSTFVSTLPPDHRE